MFDTAIVGSGPAGLSAALNLKMRDKNVIWYGDGSLSTKIEKSEMIANYPGMGMISGKDLNKRFTDHILEMDLSLTEKKVTNIMMTDNSYQILAENDIYEAKTLILAIGAVTGKGFFGEQELLGRGVSYCATCDGFLYRGKTIAVYCANPRYEHEAAFLADLAAKVYLFLPYKDSGINLPNVERPAAPIQSVEGEMKVSAVTLTNGEKIMIDGLFCLRDAVSPTVLLPNLILDGPHILVNRAMETNLRGCYAAGDCTGRPYQIAKAVGEGNIAAHSVLEFLEG